MGTLVGEVKVGPIIYRIEEVPNLNSDGAMFSGLIHYQDGLIEIEAGLGDHAKEVTLLHEVIHAVLDDRGVKEHDEDLIEILARGLLGVLKDNGICKRFYPGGMNVDGERDGEEGD